MSFSIPDLPAQIESDHERLHDVMSTISSFLEEGVEPEHFLRWKIEALFQLRDFQNQLAKHFDLEELGGFFADVIRLSPESFNRIQHLKEDHADILVELTRLISELRTADASSNILDVLKKDVQTIMLRLKGHESLESELLYSAYYQVYGAGD